MSDQQNIHKKEENIKSLPNETKKELSDYFENLIDECQVPHDKMDVNSLFANNSIYSTGNRVKNRSGA
jgi:hypothetical protein